MQVKMLAQKLNGHFRQHPDVPVRIEDPDYPQEVCLRRIESVTFIPETGKLHIRIERKHYT